MSLESADVLQAKIWRMLSENMDILKMLAWKDPMLLLNSLMLGMLNMVHLYIKAVDRMNGKELDGSRLVV